MIEFQIGDALYRADKLNAFEQCDVAVALLPVLSGAADALVRVFRNGGGMEGAVKALLESEPSAVLGPLSKAVTAMPKGDRDAVLTTCLKKVKRAQQGTVGWASVTTPAGDIMFADITDSLPLMLQIVWKVLEHSLMSFSFAQLAASK